MQEAVLNTVHSDLMRKNQRWCNITVTCLAPHHGWNDDLFEEICKRDLGFQPNVVSCKRVGESKNNRPKLMIVTFLSEDEAKIALCIAKQLRHSVVDDVRKFVYINPDITQAEAKATYIPRSERRSRTTRQRNRLTSEINLGNSASHPAQPPSSSYSSQHNDGLNVGQSTLVQQTFNPVVHSAPI
jgi:hypothetical protein